MEICLQESHNSLIRREGLAAGGYLPDLQEHLWRAPGDLIRWGKARTSGQGGQGAGRRREGGQHLSPRREGL